MGFPRLLGITLQALVLGTLLFLAVARLVGLESGAHLPVSGVLGDDTIRRLLACGCLLYTSPSPRDP